ncbi:MAG: MCE family protein [Candidatus Firestonebacteria bacterium]|nr:MCE family protein [Candidatus Firestonebacteria bacterium]
MERKKDNLSLEIKVGITAAVALVFLAMIILTVEKFHFGQKGYPIDVAFNFVDAINPQADVVIGGGVKIGRVDTIVTRGEKIHLMIFINQDVKLPSDSKFQILAKGLMGDKYVNVIPTTLTGTFLKPGDQLDGVDPASVDRAFQRLGQLADSVRTLLGDPDMKNSLVDALKNISGVTRRLDRVLAKNENNINQTLENFSAASTDIRGFSEDLDAVSKDLRLMFNEENRDNLAVTMKNLKTTSARLDAALQKIDQGQGTLGALIEDREMAENLKKLIKDLKDNPWKLLWKK